MKQHRYWLLIAAMMLAGMASAQQTVTIAPQLPSSLLAGQVATTTRGFPVLVNGAPQRVKATGITTATVTVYGTNALCSTGLGCAAADGTSLGTITTDGGTLDVNITTRYIRIFALVTAWTSGTVSAEISPLEDFFLGDAIDVRRYGVDPNNTAAQNDTALIALRAAVQAEYPKHVNVFFPPTGCDSPYQYENNRWMLNWYDVTMYADGACFQNVITATVTKQGQPINIRDPLDADGDVATGSIQAARPTYLFDSVAAGGANITLSTGTEEENFAAGDRVMLFAFDQQTGGQVPPNMRIFEFKTIASITTDDTGVITFNEAIRWSYDANWPDFTHASYGGSPSFGAPRIINLEQVNASTDVYRHPKRIEIIGATWLDNPNHSAGTEFLYIPGETVIFSGVTAEYMTTAFTGHWECDRCIVKEHVEGDKIVDLAWIHDSHLGIDRVGSNGISQFSGTNQLVVERTHIHGGAATTARRQIYRDNKIYGNTNESGAFQLPTSTAAFYNEITTFTDNEIIRQYNADQATATKFMVNMGNPITLTLGASAVPDDWTLTTAYGSGSRVRATSNQGWLWESDGGTSGGTEPTWPTSGMRYEATQADNDIIWTAVHSQFKVPDDATGHQIIQRLGIGAYLTDANGSGGYITEITHDGSDYVLRATIPQPENSAALTLYPHQRVIDGGGNFSSSNPTVAFDVNDPYFRLFNLTERVDRGRGITQFDIVATPSGTQYNAARLIHENNVIITVGTINDSVQLPILRQETSAREFIGYEVRVTNLGANTVDIYPGYNDRFFGGSSNAKVSLPSGDSEIFVGDKDSVDWYLLLGNAAP